MFTINTQLPTVVGFEPWSSHTAVRHVTARPLQPATHQQRESWFAAGCTNRSMCGKTTFALVDKAVALACPEIVEQRL